MEKVLETRETSHLIPVMPEIGSREHFFGPAGDPSAVATRKYRQQQGSDRGGCKPASRFRGCGGIASESGAIFAGFNPEARSQVHVG